VPSAESELKFNVVYRANRAEHFVIQLLAFVFLLNVIAELAAINYVCLIHSSQVNYFKTFLKQQQRRGRRRSFSDYYECEDSFITSKATERH